MRNFLHGSEKLDKKNASEEWLKWSRPWDFSRKEIIFANLLSLVPGVQNKIDNISHLFMSIGLPRSGGSLVGSIIDSHPHCLIANEYNLLSRQLSRRKPGKKLILNDLCLKSFRQSFMQSRKGYSSDKGVYDYGLKDLYQGNLFGSQSLSCIGAAKASPALIHLINDPNAIDRLVDLLEIPVKVLVVLRNPLDMYKSIHRSCVSRGDKRINKYLIDTAFLGLAEKASIFMQQYASIDNICSNIQEKYGVESVKFIYNEQLRSSPETCISEIYSWLRLPCILKDIARRASALVRSNPTVFSSQYSDEALERLNKLIVSTPCLSSMYSPV